MTRLLPLRVCNKSSSQTSLAGPPSIARALPLLLIAAAGMLFTASRAAGQTSTWINAAGGKWSTTANWLGGIPDGQDATADFSTLVLPANETVHLDSSRTVGNLIFGDAGSTYNWTLDNNGSSGNQLTLAVSSVSPSVTVDFGTADISAALAGSQGFTLSDNPNLVEVGGVPFNPSAANVAVPGTLDLNSATASSIAGPIVLQGGTLLLDLSNLATPTNLIGSSSALTLAGGGLTVNFKSGSSTSSQTFGGDTTINPGAATVAANANGNTSAGSFLSLGNITRNVGGTVNFVLPATGTITTSSFNTTSTILGGWATVNGSDWAAINANNDIVASPAAGNAYTNDVWAADTTVTMSSNFSSSSTGLTTNSLRFGATSPAGGFTVTLPNSLNTISSGGILVTPALGVNGATIATLSTGSATLTSGTTPGELVVNQFDTNGPLVFSAEITDNSGTSPTTPISLTKTGPGAVVLGNNGYSGGTYLNQGVLAIDGSGGLGSPATGGTWLTFTGNSTLQFINSGSSLSVSINLVNRAIVIDAGSTATFDNLYYPPAFSESGTGVINFNNGTAITGAGGLAFVSSIGTTGNIFTLKNTAADTYSGPTTIFGGGLKLSYASDAASNDNKLNPNNSLFLGGVLSLQPNGTAGTIPTIQTLASSTSLIPNTSSLITTTAALAGSSFGFAGTSNAGTLVRSSGSTLAFLLADASPATDAINIGKALANKQLLAGWATFGASGSVTGSTDWASTDANGNIVSFTGTYTNDAWRHANNTTVTVGDNFSTSSGALTTNSLRFNAAAGLTITLPTGANSIASGGILVTPNVGTYGNTIAGGSLTSGNGADLIINQFNPQTSSQGSLTISSAIVNPAAGGSIGLTLSGNPLGTTTTTTGLVILASTANSYSGPTAINAGITLQAKAAGVIPAASALVLSGNGIFEMENFSQTIGSLASISYGTLISGASGSNGNPGPTLTVGGNNTSTTFDGALTGGISLVKAGTGTLTLQSLPAYTDFTTNTIPGLSTYNGGTTIDGGTISIATDASLGGGRALTINGTATAPATLQATGTFTLSSNRNIFLGGTAGNSGGTIDVTSGNTLTYGGVMANASTLFTNSLTLVDSGTLLLSGASTYTGPTNVNAGTLEAGAANTIPSSSVVTVASGAALVLNGFNQSIASLIGSGTATNNSSAGATLTVGSDNGDHPAFLGVISDSTDGTTGKLSLAKIGFGMVTLSDVNTYTGSTTIGGGTLLLDFSNLAAPTNIISASSAPLLGGGTLTVNDKSGSTSTTQTFNGTAVTSGASAVTVNVNGSTSAASVLALGSFTRATGGTVDFMLPTTGNITTTTPNTNGILGAWATVELPSAGGAGWAVNSGGNIVAYSGYTNDYTSTAATTPTTNYGWGSGNNTSTISTNASQTDTIASGSTTNSLRFNTAANYTMSLSGNNTITSGGILVTWGVGANMGVPLNTIGGGGTLTAGLAADEIVVTSYVGVSTLVISAAIVNNGSGTMGVTFSGPGNLSLTNSANSYGGPTSVSGGMLKISADHDLGTVPATATAGDIVLNFGRWPNYSDSMNGGVLQTTGTFALNSNRGIALGSANFAGGGTFRVLSGTLTYGGIIANAGPNPGSLTMTGDGTLDLTGTNTYSGGTFINGGTLNINADGALGATTASPNVTFGGIASEGGATLQLATGFTGTLSSSRGITVLPFTNGGETYSGTIDTNGNGTSAAPIAYSGNLTVGSSAGSLAGAFAVFTKAGAGVFELDSDPTLFSGSSLAVSGGTLRLKYGSTPANLSGFTASVSSGATLELAGAASQLSNAVNVTNAGTLLVSSTTAAQTVGTVIGGTAAAPAGATVVNAGASLTAYQIVQNSLTIGSGATVTLAPSGSGSTTNPTGPNNINFSSTLTSLSIAGTTGAWTGTLDIGNNGLVIAYGAAANDPYATIDNMIETGFDAAHWDGTGVTSSLGRAAANSHTPLNIGLEDFTPGKGNFSTTTFIVFEGQTVTTNAILVRLTYMDDIVLSGDLNAQDASSDALIFAANYGTGTTWSVGDLEHTGLVDSADALLFAANYTPPLPSLDGTTGGSALLGSADSLAGGTAAVPEPASFLLAALAALALSAVGVFNRRRKMLPIPVTRVIPVAPPSRR